MEEPTNQDRAQRAERAILETHLATVEADDGDYDSAITDLMANLLHLAHQKGYNTEQVISLAQLHFDAEVDKEDDQQRGFA